MNTPKWSKYAATAAVVLLVCLSCPLEASGGSYILAETIDMSGYDMLNINSDGTNLLVLHNASPDMVSIVDKKGNNISTFNTPSKFNSGIAFNGSMVLFASGSNASNKYLREMNPSNGSYSGPLGPNLGSVMGLGFDGANIMVSYYANGSNGILTSNITLVDPVSYAITGTISVTMDTKTSISGTPTYGVASHKNHLFVSLQGVDKVYEFDSNQNLVNEIPIITSWPRGIAFIGDDLFVADRGAKKIYRYECADALSADTAQISESAGGVVNLTLDAGPANGGRNYLIFAGVTGTTPGFTPPPGLVTIPVNWDNFTNLALKLTNTIIFNKFYGALDANGQASADFNTLGPFTGGAGLTINFAFGVDLTYWDFASNAVSIDVVP